MNENNRKKWTIVIPLGVLLGGGMVAFYAGWKIRTMNSGVAWGTMFVSFLFVMLISHLLWNHVTETA